MCCAHSAGERVRTCAGHFRSSTEVCPAADMAAQKNRRLLPKIVDVMPVEAQENVIVSFNLLRDERIKRKTLTCKSPGPQLTIMSPTSGIVSEVSDELVVHHSHKPLKVPKQLSVRF